MIPRGWVLTADKAKVRNITARLKKTKGHCPCVPNDQWDDDTICPCKDLRDGESCHCGLYERAVR